MMLLTVKVVFWSVKSGGWRIADGLMVWKANGLNVMKRCRNRALREERC